MRTPGPLSILRTRPSRKEPSNSRHRDAKYEQEGKEYICSLRFSHNLVDQLDLDLKTFREALSVLQRQVNDLDELKASHYQEIVEHEEQVWDVVQGKVDMQNMLCHTHMC
jgi:hypothetical protein